MFKYTAFYYDEYGSRKMFAVDLIMAIVSRSLQSLLILIN